MSKKPPPTEALPVITPTEGIARLQELIERTDGLLRKATTFEEVDAYRAALNGALTDAFGSDSDWTHRTYGAGAIGSLLLGGHYDPIAERHDELRAKHLLLVECIEELKRRAARAPVVAPPALPSSLEVVEHILRRFHIVARHLRNRRAPSPPLKMENEYDVQYLLHALLLVSFRDVRPEETAPSHAGSGPRLDFLLKEEQIVIEVKKTRPSLTDKEVGEELLIDISRYAGHRDCKTLVCFVYDPDDHIKNPAALIRDLEEHSSAELQVRVLVVPHH